MLVNKNLTSIAKASSHFLKAQFPINNGDIQNGVTFELKVPNDEFSIIYKSGFYFDGSEYNCKDSYESYVIDQKKLNSVVRFHIGLVLPKEKGKKIRHIAKKVISHMKHGLAFHKPGWGGESLSFYKYSISLSSFIEIVENEFSASLPVKH